MQIHKCVMSDLEAVAAFYDQVNLHLERTINYPKWKYGIYPSEESVREAIQSDTQYMCTEDGTVLGAFVLNTDPQGDYQCGEWRAELKEGEYLVIHTLAVNPNFLGRGVGNQMVAYSIVAAKKRGLRAVRLDVVPDNTPAIRLYERLGFQWAGTKDLKRNMEDIPIFSLYEYNLE